MAQGYAHYVGKIIANLQMKQRFLEPIAMPVSGHEDRDWCCHLPELPESLKIPKLRGGS
jgi:hypothetical protein